MSVELVSAVAHRLKERPRYRVRVQGSLFPRHEIEGHLLIFFLVVDGCIFLSRRAVEIFFCCSSTLAFNHVRRQLHPSCVSRERREYKKWELESESTCAVSFLGSAASIFVLW